MTTDHKPKRGRPFKPEHDRRVQRSIRLLQRHWDKIDAAGKEALEAYLDRWTPDIKKPAE